ncbi:MAG: Crp/Fnr family transcriptional regulator [Candidatus Acidiferrales bacterium]|jgi:CRP/FNR family transcriptional regulator
MNFRGGLQLRRNLVNADSFLSDMSAGLTRQHAVDLAAEILPVYHTKGGIFFFEGQAATGVFLLRTGRAKESVTSNTGKTAITRVVGPGVMLGLSAILTDAPYEATVETLETTRADYIRKSAFLNFLKISSQLNQMVAKQLSRSCKEAYGTIRCLGASDSVAERIARLLIQWSECPLPKQNRNTVGTRILVTLTHEEIGQSVGSTRETTTRILGELRKKEWITVNGSIWTITNEDAIRRLAAV